MTAARCTHGGDCTVHPTVRGLHDFTPTASAALSAVMQLAMEFGGTITAGQIAVLAKTMDVALDVPASEPSEAPAYNLDPDREGKTWARHGRPATGIWWGFVIPGRNRQGWQGFACTLECEKGRIWVTFPDGTKIHFGISRLFRLGVI